MNRLFERIPSLIPGLCEDEIMYLDYNFDDKPYCNRINALDWWKKQKDEENKYGFRRHKESNE